MFYDAKLKKNGILSEEERSKKREIITKSAFFPNLFPFSFAEHVIFSIFENQFKSRQDKPVR